MIIRSYQLKDRNQVENVHLETAFLGKSLAPFIHNKSLWSHQIHYYLDKEPQSAFVAENQGKIIGYLLGCLDDKKEGGTAHFIKYNITTLFHLPFMHKKDKLFWKGHLNVLWHNALGKAEEKNLKEPTPAGHLHINLLPQARGKQVGSKLLKKFFSYAKKNGTTIIHANSFKTKLNNNTNFWIKKGFKEYDKVKTIFWKNLLPNEEMELVCYVTKIK